LPNRVLTIYSDGEGSLLESLDDFLFSFRFVILCFGNMRFLFTANVLASSLSIFIRIVLIRNKASDFSCIVPSRRIVSTVAAIASCVAIDKLLLRESYGGSVLLDSDGGLQGGGSREGPAGSTALLVLDFGQLVGSSPVN